jgi:hypothetical protein
MISLSPWPNATVKNLAGQPLNNLGWAIGCWVVRFRVGWLPGPNVAKIVWTYIHWPRHFLGPDQSFQGSHDHR